MGSKDPKTVASGLTWMGRHLGEMLWRFQVCMDADRRVFALQDSAADYVSGGGHACPLLWETGQAAASDGEQD